MSDNHSPLAIFRGHPNQQLARIGEEHLQNDLRPEDRDKLKKAASQVSTHAAIGSLLGLGLGIALAWRVRANRIALYKAFRTTEKPTEVVFANGRRETIPDLDPYIKPTGWGDVATYTFFGLSGLFIGGETGFLTGSASASSTITRDVESRRRIEEAFRKFRIDVLKEEIKGLEGNSGGSSTWKKLRSQASSLETSLKKW